MSKNSKESREERDKLSEKIKALKTKQAKCNHTYKKVKRTWKLKGVISEVEKLFKCSKCRKEIPRDATKDTQDARENSNE